MSLETGIAMRLSWLRESAADAVEDAEKLLADCRPEERVPAASLLALLHGIKVLECQASAILKKVTPRNPAATGKLPPRLQALLDAARRERADATARENAERTIAARERWDVLWTFVRADLAPDELVPFADMGGMPGWWDVNAQSHDVVIPLPGCAMFFASYRWHETREPNSPGACGMAGWTRRAGWTLGDPTDEEEDWRHFAELEGADGVLLAAADKTEDDEIAF